MDFLPYSDLFYIIVFRKGSFSFGTFDLCKKWHQHTVIEFYLPLHEIQKLSPHYLQEIKTEVC